MERHSLAWKTVTGLALFIASFAFKNFLDRYLSPDDPALPAILVVAILVWLLLNLESPKLYLWRQNHPMMSTLIAGSIAFILIAIVWNLAPLRPPAPEPAREAPASKEDVAKLQQLVEKLGARDGGHSGLIHQHLPGFSVQSLIRIRKVPTNRRSYIFDIGQKSRSRFSAYTSPGGQFVLSLTDTHGEAHALRVPLSAGADGVPKGSVFLLTCEYGIGERRFLRVSVNTKAVSFMELPFVVDDGALAWKPGSPEARTVFGSDIDYSNGAFFDAFYLLVYATTMNTDDLHTNLIAIVEEKLRKPIHLKFEGHHFVRWQQAPSSNTPTG